MNNQPKKLIYKDDDISIYEKRFTNTIPNSRCIGGHIYIVNNHNNEQRWKEWKWYSYEDGTMFNDREYVIHMLTDIVSKLHLAEESHE